MPLKESGRLDKLLLLRKRSQAEKSRLIALLSATNNEGIIAELRKVFERLYEKPYSQKELDKMVADGEADIESGKIFTSQEVLKDLESWRKK